MLSIRCMSIGMKHGITPFKLQSRNISRYGRGVNLFFRKNLLLKNIIAGGSCMFVGDLLQQELEYRRKHLKSRYDWERLARMIVVGMGLATMQHFFYGYLDHLLPAVNLKTVAQKIILDQIILSTILIIYFFYATGILDQQPLEEITADLKKKFLYVYTRDWMYWPPVQFINFYFLPLRHRVVYINVAQIIYNLFLSSVRHNLPVV